MLPGKFPHLTGKTGKSESLNTALRSGHALRYCHFLAVSHGQSVLVDLAFDGKGTGTYHPRFFVNHPYSFKDILTGWLSGNRILRSRLPDLLRGRPRYEALPEIPDNFVALQPPPTWPVNWLPKGVVYDFFQRINNRIVLRAIRRLLRDHRVRRYAYINCYDPFFAGVLPPEMGAVKSIYHCIDDISQDPYTAKHGEDLESSYMRCGSDAGDIRQVISTEIAPFRQDSSVFQRSRRVAF
ncbi:MAG: hypothetical protein R2791_14000 [Saprospiraceae bacterium]